MTEGGKAERPVIDTPMLVAESPAKQLEREAIAAYRAKHPDGPAWQDLSFTTRCMWIEHLERNRRP